MLPDCSFTFSEGPADLGGNTSAVVNERVIVLLYFFSAVDAGQADSLMQLLVSLQECLLFNVPQACRVIFALVLARHIRLRRTSVRTM